MVCGAVGPVHITSSRPLEVASAASSDGGSSPPERSLHRRELARLGQRGAQIQAIARAGQRDIQQPLGLLALARDGVLVGLALVLADRHQRFALLLAARGTHRHRESGSRPPPLPAEVDDEHDRELEALRGVDGHQVDRVGGVDDRVRFVAAGDELRRSNRRAAPSVA